MRQSKNVLTTRFLASHRYIGSMLRISNQGKLILIVLGTDGVRLVHFYTLHFHMSVDMLSFVQEINFMLSCTSMPMYLFSYSRRCLYGLFKAESEGQMNINQHGAVHIFLLYEKASMKIICFILYTIVCLLDKDDRGKCDFRRIGLPMA